MVLIFKFYFFVFFFSFKLFVAKQKDPHVCEGRHQDKALTHFMFHIIHMKLSTFVVAFTHCFFFSLSLHLHLGTPFLSFLEPHNYVVLQSCFPFHTMKSNFGLDSFVSKHSLKCFSFSFCLVFSVDHQLPCLVLKVFLFLGLLYFIKQNILLNCLYFSTTLFMKNKKLT